MHNMHNPPGNDQQISPLFRSAWFWRLTFLDIPFGYDMDGSFLEEQIHESILKKVTNSDFGWEKWGDSNCPTTEVVPRFHKKNHLSPRYRPTSHERSTIGSSLAERNGSGAK